MNSDFSAPISLASIMNLRPSNFYCAKIRMYKNCGIIDVISESEEKNYFSLEEIVEFRIPLIRRTFSTCCLSRVHTQEEIEHKKKREL